MRAAITAALVRVQIVLRINVLADEFVTREVLVQGALSAHLALAIEPLSSPQARDATMKVTRPRARGLRHRSCDSPPSIACSAL